jgi:hypothetical protein
MLFIAEKGALFFMDCGGSIFECNGFEIKVPRLEAICPPGSFNGADPAGFAAANGDLAAGAALAANEGARRCIDGMLSEMSLAKAKQASSNAVGGRIGEEDPFCLESELGRQSAGSHRVVNVLGKVVFSSSRDFFPKPPNGGILATFGLLGQIARRVSEMSCRSAAGALNEGRLEALPVDSARTAANDLGNGAVEAQRAAADQAIREAGFDAGKIPEDKPRKEDGSAKGKKRKAAREGSGLSDEDGAEVEAALEASGRDADVSPPSTPMPRKPQSQRPI